MQVSRMRWLAAVLALAWGSGGCASFSTSDPALEGVVPRESVPLAAVARPGAPVDYEVLVGELAAQEARFEEARDAYLRASHKDPHSAYLQRKLARLSLKLEDVDAAVIHAARAFALEPDDEDTRLFLARIHRIRLDLAGVESVLLGPDGDPVSPRAVLLLYQIYLERSRLSEALKITQQLVDEHPEMLDGHMALATV